MQKTGQRDIIDIGFQYGPKFPVVNSSLTSFGKREIRRLVCIARRHTKQRVKKSQINLSEKSAIFFSPSLPYPIPHDGEMLNQALVRREDPSTEEISSFWT